MPTIKRLTSKLRLRKEQNFDEQPDQYFGQAPGASSKRPVAKLRKENKRTLSGLSQLDEEQAGVNRTESASNNSLLVNNGAQHSGNIPRYCWAAGPPEDWSARSTPFYPEQAGEASVSNPGLRNQAERDIAQHVSASPFLLNWTKRKLGKTVLKDEPVDNFTKWDDGRHARNQPLSSSSRINMVNSPYHRTQAFQRDQTESSEDQEFHSARETQDDGVPLAISDIDWSRYEDNEHLLELLKLLKIEQQGHESGQEQPSPTDSGIFVDNTPPSGDKGKGRAQAAESSRQPNVDKVLALELALRLEIAEHEREWADRAEALELQKNEELELLRQEEDDRVRARQIQEEEDRLARQLQEEEERIVREIQEEEDRRARLRDCVCCGDQKDIFNFSAKKATSTCEHALTTCTDCMQQWLASEFESKGCDELKCPECPQTLTYADIETHASEETFLSYEKLLTRNALGTLDEFSWCLSPTCTSGQLNAENNHFMECAACSYKQCLSCKIAWHTGETCEAYQYRISGQKDRDERAAEERATDAMIDTVSKKCPGKKCGWRIQKTEGCDHMTCKKCKHEFCWECLAGHREIRRVGNEAHQEWCKFHTKNLGTSEMAWPFAAHR